MEFHRFENNISDTRIPIHQPLDEPQPTDPESRRDCLASRRGSTFSAQKIAARLKNKKQRRQKKEDVPSRPRTRANEPPARPPNITARERGTGISNCNAIRREAGGDAEVGKKVRSEGEKKRRVDPPDRLKKREGDKGRIIIYIIELSEVLN